MSRWIRIAPALAVAIVAGCQDVPTNPGAADERAAPATPSFSVQDAWVLGSTVTGAIFTTTPNGGIVNENVRYQAKIEVYLDGGPPGRAPQTAAGLKNGLYVFQVTDPPGKLLLSQDPSKCRIVRVEDGVIKELVKPSNLPGSYGTHTDTWSFGNGANQRTYPCHVQDAPDGEAGASGRHDTNTDLDHGASGAIVVQLMPFLDTPNPGGVYKAWMTPLAEYVRLGGSLTAIPLANEVKVKGQLVGYGRDPGFGPPLSKVKTDNFKVRENPPFIVVRKYDDVDGSRTLAQPPDTLVQGWPVLVIEPVDGGNVLFEGYTTTDPIRVPFNTTVKVCERVLNGWTFSFARVDGQPAPATDETIEGLAYKCVSVTTGSAFATVDVAFGNFRPVTKSGRKLDSITGAPLAGWTIYLLDSQGNVLATGTTGADGGYAFSGLTPGVTYIVCEEARTDWVQTHPSSGYDCGAHSTAYAPYGYRFTPTSGVDHPNNDFRNRNRFHGCTPGYWKQSQHFGNWTAPYSPVPPQTLLSAAFNRFNGQGGYSAQMTMLQALDLDNSTGIGQVLRHGTAALLNAAHPGVTFPLSQDGVKDLVNSALDAFSAGNQTFVNSVHARLAGYNESSDLGCPLARSEL